MLSVLFLILVSLRFDSQLRRKEARAKNEALQKTPAAEVRATEGGEGEEGRDDRGGAITLERYTRGKIEAADPDKRCDPMREKQ